MIEGVKIEPSLFSKAFGSPLTIEAYLVIAVPKSIPKTFVIFFFNLFLYLYIIKLALACQE
jgi:hypothetical protein